MTWTQIAGPLADTAHDHDLDYDAIGAAAAAVSAHEGAANPHPTYLTEAEADALYSDIVHDHDLDYEPIGTVTTHESAVNPHPTYLTEAEADLLYSDILHDHDADYAPIDHKHLVVVNSQTGTTYTLVLADAHKTVEFDNASAIALTVPTNASVAYAVGTVIELTQVGAGQVTVAGDSGVTVNGYIGLKLAGQWAHAKLVKRASDTWILSGDLAA